MAKNKNVSIKMVKITNIDTPKKSNNCSLSEIVLFIINPAKNPTMTLKINPLIPTHSQAETPPCLKLSFQYSLLVISIPSFYSNTYGRTSPRLTLFES